MTIDSQKAELRQRARKARAPVHAARGQAAATAIADIGLGFLNPPAGTIVSGYAAMGDELDPGPLLARLRHEGLALALPVTIARGKPLVFRAWQPGDEMAHGSLGVREPLPTARQLAPDVLLCPLLAYDDLGYRIGYGAGYYDRSLQQLRKTRQVIAIGLAFDEQKVDAVPHDGYDQQLDWMLTPTGARRCVGLKRQA